jgi:flagellar biosynthetic protein FlhB
MADDQEKTQPPTQRRIQQAREQGQIPRSRELVTAVMMLSTAAFFSYAGETWYASAKQVFTIALQFDHSMLIDISRMKHHFAQLALPVAVILLPFLGVIFLAIIISNLSVGGWIWSSQAFAPNFGKLNPISGIGRIFSIDSIAETIKSIIKTLVIGSIAVYTIWNDRSAWSTLFSETGQAAIQHLMTLMTSNILTIASSFILIAAIDVPWQLWRYYDRLKMSKEEIKQEFKQSEGSPEVKGRIRQIQREQARKRMMSEVPKADVILTNPTHFAVAIQYAQNGDSAPRLLAKGSDVIAERIRSIASEHGVPLFETPALTRALFKHTELGQEIPAVLYTGVAQVLAYIYQLKAFQQGQGLPPVSVGDIPVPTGWDPLESTPFVQTTSAQ